MKPGVNASRSPAVSAQDVANRRALNFGVQHQASAHLSPARASVSGSIGVTGVTALLVVLAGLWALDRYVRPSLGAQ